MTDSEHPDRIVLVVTTAGSAEEAERLAHSLVEARLAACVNIVPEARSVYRWQERLERSEEWLLLIKTTASRFDDLKDAMKRLHSYELPELVAWPAALVESRYAEWVAGCVRRAPPS